MRTSGWQQHHLTPLIFTLCPCCILSPPPYGPGLHPSGEERPSSWSLLQLWQTRPHHEGLLRATHPEHPEHRCYDDSETCSQGLAVPHGIPEGDSNSIVDGEVSPPVLLLLNLTQLKSHGIRLW